MSEKEAFTNEWQAPEKPKKGLKINNQKSVVAKEVEDKNRFEQAAEEYIQEEQERNKRIIELAGKFVLCVKDQTLPENKNPIQKDLEKDVQAKLISFGLMINQDENQIEGYGSIALINLLFKTTFIQRDEINKLGYKLNQLENKLKEIEKK